MKWLKRPVLLFLLFVLAVAQLFAGGTGEADTPPKGEAPLNIFVSILPQSYFVERITGDFAKINVLVPPGRSPATYDPTPKQVSALGGADLFFTIGVPFENSFLPSLQGNLPQLRIVDTARGIERRKIQSEVEPEGEDHHEEG